MRLRDAFGGDPRRGGADRETVVFAAGIAGSGEGPPGDREADLASVLAENLDVGRSTGGGVLTEEAVSPHGVWQLRPVLDGEVCRRTRPMAVTVNLQSEGPIVYAIPDRFNED